MVEKGQVRHRSVSVLVIGESIHQKDFEATTQGMEYDMRRWFLTSHNIMV